MRGTGTWKKRNPGEAETTHWTWYLACSGLSSPTQPHLLPLTVSLTQKGLNSPGDPGAVQITEACAALASRTFVTF